LHQYKAQLILNSEPVGEIKKGSNPKYKALFEKAINPIIILAEEGNCIDCNNAALHFFRCSLDALKTKNFFKYFILDKERKSTALKEGGIVEAEFCIQNKHKVLELTVTPVNTYDKKLFYCVGRDVTEKVKFKEALKESEEKFRTLFDNANDSIFLV